jgi:D-apionolactonase
MTDRAIKLLGTAQPQAKSRLLTAGALTAIYNDGALRTIRYRGVEVLRGIAFLARDKNWGTYGAAIEGLKIRRSKDGFTVSYHATCRDAEQAIGYAAAITARSDGTLVFSALGTPETDFLTNRTGFVVLHPLQGVVGKPVAIVHTDGKTEKSRFPSTISPGQPVFDIHALKHTVMPGVTATVLMEGDKFEMEDHRNWMDASYKTYVCSLLDPWPYTLKKGEDFTQSISLIVAGEPKTKVRVKAGKAIAIDVGAPAGAMPSIGIGLPMLEAAAALDASQLIAAANPGHLVAQIDGRIGGAARAAAAFRELKERTGRPLHLEIILPAKRPAAEEMAAIAKDVNTGGLKPDAVIVTQVHDLKSFQPGTPRPSGPSYEEMAAAARQAFPGVTLGGGMLSYFTELNRKRPPSALFDFITHSVCPIVHMADDVSVMETLESIPSIAASTRAMIGKAPYHIGPSSIPCRANPYGLAPAANPGNGRVCLSDADPRQRALFGAAWTLGLIAGFAQNGVTAIAAGSATGKAGMIGAKGAAVTPLYHVIAGLAAAQGAKRLKTAHDGQNRVAALAFRSKAGPELWLANLTAEPHSIRVKGLTGAAAIVLLDAGSYDRAIKGGPLKAMKVKRLASVELSAYAVMMIKSG